MPQATRRPAPSVIATASPRLKAPATSRAAARGGEEGPQRIAAEEPREDVRLPPIGDDDVGAAGERQLRRLKLRGHAADAAAARIAGQPLDPGVDALHAGG